MSDHSELTPPPSRADISRRTLLQLAMAAGVGTALPSAARAQAPGEAAALAAPKGSVTAALPPQPGPYRLSANSQLSQDYYRTSEVLLNIGDEVFPFLQPDGAGAALVLQNGALSVAMPDPTKPGGYTLTVVSVPTPQVPGNVTITGSAPTGVAVGTHSDGKTYVLLAVPTSVVDGTPPDGYMNMSFLWCTLQASGGAAPSLNVLHQLWQSPTGAAFSSSSPPLVGANSDPSGNLSMWGFLPGTDYVVFVGGQPDPRLAAIPGSIGNVQDGALLRYGNNDYIVVFDNTTNTLTLCIGQSAAGLGQYSQVRILRVDTINQVDQNGTASTGPALLYWAVDSAGSGLFMLPLTNLFHPAGNGNWYETPPTMVQQFDQFEDATTINAGGLWRLATTSTVSAKSGQVDMLQMVIQYAALSEYASSFTSPLPFQQDVDRVWAAFSPSTQTTTTLFIRDSADQTLQVLSRAAKSAWSRTPVVLSGGAKTQDVTHWRTALTVRDANGVPVPNYPLKVIADERISAWQEKANTPLSPDTPATFTTDPMGRVVFGTPASSLHAAQLTVSGSNLSAVVVPVAANVQSFFGGNGPLPPQYGSLATGTFTSAGLIDAKVPSNGTTVPLATVFTGQSSDTSTADSIVSMVTSCARAGTDAKPASGQPSQFTYTSSGGTTHYSDSRQPGYVHGAGQLTGTKLRLGDIFDDIGDVVDDVAHAIENAVETVATATFEYVESAGKWVGQLAVTFANGVEAVFDYVISDLKSAFAAVAGVLRAIGAELKKVLAWVRALLDGLIKDAVELAATLNASLQAAPAAVATHVAPLRSKADHLFTRIQGIVDPRLDQIISAVGGQQHNTVSSSSAIAFGAGQALQAATTVMESFVDDVQANWVLDKFVALVGLPTISPSSTLTAAVDAFFAQFTADALTDIEQAAQDAVGLLLKAISNNPGNVATYALADVVTLFKTIFDQACTLFDTGIDLLIDLGLAVLKGTADFLGAALDSGILGVVNDVLDLLGIDFDVTLGSLGCLALAFPATVFKDTIVDLVAPGAAGAPRLAPATDANLAVYTVAVLVDLPITLLQDGLAAIDGQPTKAANTLGIVGVLCSLVRAVLSYPSTTPLESNVGAPPKPFTVGAFGLDTGTDTFLVSWLISLLIPVQQAVFTLPGFVDLSKIPELGTVTSFLKGSTAGLVMVQELALAVDQLSKDSSVVAGTAIPQVFTNRLTVAMSLLTNQKINEANEYVPVAVKAVADVVDAIGFDALLITSTLSG